MTDQPLVSCLMVTADRAHLARRAIACLAAQTHRNVELVIVDDGEQDYGPMLDEFRDQLTIHYHRIARDPDVFLGGLRNRSLELANGEFCVQWDDDEWYEPERIEVQLAHLLAHDYDAVVLRYVLVHMDAPEYRERAFRSDSVDGTCGTILHRKSDIRYPNQRKSEDLVYLEAFAERGRVGCMEEGCSHLFVRCYHGTNTWDVRHFEGRLHKTVREKVEYFICRYLRRDVFRHSNFRLDPREQQTLRNLLEGSRKLGLLDDCAEEGAEGGARA